MYPCVTDRRVQLDVKSYQDYQFYRVNDCDVYGDIG